MQSILFQNFCVHGYGCVCDDGSSAVVATVASRVSYDEHGLTQARVSGHDLSIHSYRRSTLVSTRTP